MISHLTNLPHSKPSLILAGIVSITLSLSGCGKLTSFSGQKETANIGTDASAYAQTLGSMNGAKGLTQNAYMTKEIQDSIHKLAKLHQTVSELQDRMTVISPSMQQLTMMKEEINSLGMKFDQMQASLHMGHELLDVPMGNMMRPSASTMGEGNASPYTQRPMQTLTADAKPVKMADLAIKTSNAASTVKPRTPQRFATSVQAGQNGLLNIRLGEHRGKTRIVLDTAKKSDIRYDLDKGENILVVELPGQSANGLSSKSFPKSRLIKGYDVQQNGDMTLVIFMFKKATNILEMMQLPGKGSAAHRIVFDMAK